MPGLSGFVSREPIRSPDRLLDQYERVHALDNAEYVKASYADNHAAILLLVPSFGGSTRESAIACHEDDLHFFLEGLVFDASGPTGKSSNCGDPESVRSLASLFLKNRREFPGSVNGEFNFVAFDAKNRSLTIFTDHLSTRPIYFMETASGLHFGSEKKSILATQDGDAELDPVGLLQIFNHKHYLGTRTFIRDLKRLPPGMILEYKDGKAQVLKWATIDFASQAGRIGADSLMHEWQEILCDATRRRVPEPSRLVISLSAGLDSRAVALSIDRAHRPIVARTRGIESSDELVFGRKIAQRLGFEHLTEDPEMFNPTKAVDAIVWRTEGEATIFNGPTLLNHGELLRHGDHLAGGYLGDVCSGAHIDPRMMVPQSLTSFAERMYAWYQSNAYEKLRNVFRSEFLNRHLPEVRTEFIESYEPIRQSRNVDTHQAWDLVNRQTRMTMAAAPVDNHLFQRVSPFYDRRHLEFVTALPLKYRFGQALYKSLIYSMGPEVRDVPNSNTMQCLRASVGANRTDFLVHLAKKMRTRVAPVPKSPNRDSMGLRPSESKTDMVLLDRAFRARLELFIHSDACDPEVFDRAALLSMLEQHYDRRRDFGHLIGLVATFSAALPMFVYGKSSECPEAAQPAAAAIRATCGR